MLNRVPNASIGEDQNCFEEYLTSGWEIRVESKLDSSGPLVRSPAEASLGGPLFEYFFVGISLTVLSSLMFLLDPLLIKWLIDRVLPKKDLHLLLFAAAGACDNERRSRNRSIIRSVRTSVPEISHA
jgi:hypothetical protein